jgi:arylsulfatase A-like enzyme
LIIAAPAVTQAGSRTQRSVGLIDLFPTLNELCQLPKVDSLEGQSLVPLLKNPSIQWDRPALTTHGQGNHALRTERWRYIRYADGGEELYDHQNDPDEWHNLARLADYATVKDELNVWLPKQDAQPLGKHNIDKTKQD